MNRIVSHTVTSRRLDKHIELSDQALDPTVKWVQYRVIRIICCASYARCSIIKACLIRPHISRTLHARIIEQNRPLSVVYDCAPLRLEAAPLWVLTQYPVRLSCITRPRKRPKAKPSHAPLRWRPNWRPGRNRAQIRPDILRLQSYGQRSTPVYFPAANGEHAAQPLHEQKYSQIHSILLRPLLPNTSFSGVLY